MLEDIKINDEYFDQDFFAYLEDVDLDWRAQLFGWKCIYTPKAVAYHNRGTLWKKAKDKMNYYSFRNKYLTLIKNENSILLLHPLHILFYIYFIIEELRSLFKNKLYRKAMFDSLLIIPKMLKKRRIIQKRRKSKIPYINRLYKIENKDIKHLIKYPVTFLVIYLTIHYFGLMVFLILLILDTLYKSIQSYFLRKAQIKIQNIG